MRLFDYERSAMSGTELRETREAIQGKTEQDVCNREAGSFSRLWGRDCWVADSVLKLIQSSIDEDMNQHDPNDPLFKVYRYCAELREKNRIGEFPNTFD
jgi:hypothetical protein